MQRYTRTGAVRQRVKTLNKDDIFLRKYSDLLMLVERAHREFLTKYDQLRKAKGIEKAAAAPTGPTPQKAAAKPAASKTKPASKKSAKAKVRRRGPRKKR